VSAREGDPAVLLRAARDGDRGALARLITRIERGGETAAEVAALLPAGEGAAHVVGVTGAPGAGKSSLTGHLLAHLAGEGLRPAVLAIDPSSPVTGGAILGDRVRMDGVAPGAFVRSMATRGHQGGLAAAVPAALRLLAHAGHDPVIVETTGVGQVEVDVVAAADTTVLVVAPGWGDAVQANKAGLLEVADVLVVNKADRPGAADARRDLEQMLDLGHISGLEARSGRRAGIVMATSTTGEGAAEVWRAVAAHRAAIAADGELDARRARRRRGEVVALVGVALRARTDAALAGEAGRAALADVAAGRIPADAGAAEVLRAVLDGG
jgi:LAO/AO transport system kinase